VGDGARAVVIAAVLVVAAPLKDPGLAVGPRAERFLPEMAIT
jgi:hypothetical protein